MIGSLSDLVFAMVAFVGGHFLLSWHPIRVQIIGLIGEWPFRGLYSIMAALSLIWAVLAYQVAPEVILWDPHMAFQHMPMSMMVPVCLLLVAGYTAINPTAIGMESAAARQPLAGIFAITRHPVMWAVGLWGVTHALSRGDAASLIFFGGMAVLALGGSLAIDRRKAKEGGLLWERLRQETSNVPFVAIIQGRARTSPSDIGWWRLAGGTLLFVVLLFWHDRILGVPPLPGVPLF
ncbi:NnrU family protein [Magnetospira sp. QH-2]|uniref:NnrU family protein n=1 Tax=Magnetospira sp. (strain QH-2) TaxID=1288970 RepID=UPI0003E81277|nr:NnrU family protein [Magnetospira sp. QH-2]CCQ73367.1 Conserved membrane protein of unknown function [Magnetospira sp. QH-2]